jgi:DNA invertase Pin-like site-specific DNA recombinase
MIAMGRKPANAQPGGAVCTEGLDLAETFTEIETGKGADALDRRPQLAAALKAARQQKAPIVVAKLDRLSQRRAFHFGADDAPDVVHLVAELGADTDPLILHIYAALAEKERRLISERTRGLQAAKRRGTKLGGLNAKGLENQRAAAERAEQLRPVFAELAGLSARQAAAEFEPEAHRE